MVQKGVRGTQLSKRIDMPYPTFSKRINHGGFTVEEFIKIANELEIPQAEYAYYMEVKTCF
jgi:hypothetical protein